MKETPQRLRSFAPPTRDKILIWSAVIAGCCIMALLGRHAAITRFGTDVFTGNILFAAFLVLSIGLYFGFQSVIEDVFKRLQSLFRHREVMAIAETTTGEQIAISTPEEPSGMPMQFSESISDEVCIEEDEVGFAEEIDNDSSFEVLEIIEGMRHIRFSDGTEAYVGMDLSNDDILHQKAYDDSRDYEAELEEAYKKHTICMLTQ